MKKLRYPIFVKTFPHLVSWGNASRPRLFSAVAGRAKFVRNVGEFARGHKGKVRLRGVEAVAVVRVFVLIVVLLFLVALEAGVLGEQALYEGGQGGGPVVHTVPTTVRESLSAVHL